MPGRGLPNDRAPLRMLLLLFCSCGGGLLM